MIEGLKRETIEHVLQERPEVKELFDELLSLPAERRKEASDIIYRFLVEHRETEA